MATKPTGTDARPSSRHLAVAVAVEENPRDHGRGRARLVLANASTASVPPRRPIRVEAKPPEPQSLFPKSQRDVRRVSSCWIRRPKNDAPANAAHPADMCTTCRRQNQARPRAKQAFRMPSHVAERRVHHQREQDHEQDVSTEAHTARRTACDERGGDDGELQLEQGEQQKRYRAAKSALG